MSNVWDSFGDDTTSAQRIAEWLLVETVGDLEHRCREGATAYERIGISAILRRLLTDGRPILYPALARLSLPDPIFKFTPHQKPYEPPGAKMRLAVAFGNASKEPRTNSGDLEAFLGSVAAHSFGEPVSVLDVIRQFAYTYGGVHLGIPTSPFQRVVQRIGSVMTLDAVGWSRSLVGIATVTLEAIRPIADELVAQPYPTPETLGRIPSAAELQAMREQRYLD